MRWKIAEAKAHFAEVVRRAEESPQYVFRRNEPVAAVVGGKDLALLAAQRRKPSATLAELTEPIREAAAEEGWRLEVPTRKSRPVGTRRSSGR